MGEIKGGFLEEVAPELKLEGRTETNQRGAREVHSRQGEQLLRNAGKRLAGPEYWRGTEVEGFSERIRAWLWYGVGYKGTGWGKC